MLPMILVRNQIRDELGGKIGKDNTEELIINSEGLSLNSKLRETRIPIVYNNWYIGRVQTPRK
jgi:hypothetical protein